MAQPATNPKIEELRFKIKNDPKSRLFYQLAEELRKVKSFEESEQVLRTGLQHHATYLAAWVSLGRTLREVDKHKESIEAFTKALQLDPSNVVAARLMADAYLDLGDKVEAIKKYKLVRALLPVDEELNATIDRLEDEINPVTIHPAPAVVDEPKTLPPHEESPFNKEPPPLPESEPIPATPFGDESPFASVSPFPAEDTFPARPTREAQVAVATADVEPMRVAHEESPFEEPAPSFSSAAVEIEQPQGIHVEEAPPAAEVPAPVVMSEPPAPWPDDEPAADVFEPAQPMATFSGDNVANTVTMADLYVQQGFLDRAQSIYESILDRDPNNEDVRAKLDALDRQAASKEQPQAMEPLTAGERNAKVDRLEGWLTKLKRGEARRV
jgi:tetratricopeptide (TPR) repeat protein